MKKILIEVEVPDDIRDCDLQISIRKIIRAPQSTCSEALPFRIIKQAVQVHGEPVAWMVVYPDCESGLVETTESAAFEKLLKSPAGSELVPLCKCSHPLPMAAGGIKNENSARFSQY